MFGFGLKDKAKKILEDDIGVFSPTPSWLNHIVSEGKKQEYNEYDIAICYCITEWDFEIDQAIKFDSNKEYIHQQIKSQREKLSKIEHLAHQDLTFQDLSFRKKIDQIVKKSEELLK
jgi:hypothetical protein